MTGSKVLPNVPTFCFMLDIIPLDGTDDTDKPLVMLHDHSRNGIWVNAERVGKGAAMRLDSGFTVHFTKPGTTPAGVTPMVYKFEFLNFHGSLSVCPQREADEVLEHADMTVVADESFEATQLATPADPSSPLKKKRKRMDEDLVAVTVATHLPESELEATKRLLKIAESKLEAAEAEVARKEGLEESLQAQVDNRAKEGLDLMVKLKASIAENRQLKTDLATKDNEMEAKIREATTKSLEATLEKNVESKEEAIAKEKAMELKIKQSLTKIFEADREAQSQEMAAKLKNATKKYQQQVEAEHYEKRRETSEKMAAFANENEKLQTALGIKDEELAECKDKIVSLQEKIAAVEEKVTILSAREKNVAVFEKKVAELEEKLSVSKDESAEILGLLAAAEEKIAAAENKAAEADIAAAAAHTNASHSTDASERHELHKSISSLRGELETYRAQLANQGETHKPRKVPPSVVTAALTSSAAESGPQGEYASILRARLAAALDVFSQVQALGLQGVSLTTMTNSSLLFMAPSAESKCDSTAVPKPSSSLPAEDGQGGLKDSSEEKSAKTSAKKAAEDCDEANVECAIESVKEAAETKTSGSKLKRENKPNKQTASMSVAIEADAVVAIAAMKSGEGRG